MCKNMEKDKNNEKLTIEEKMIKYMYDALATMCEYVVSYNKGFSIDYTIIGIKKQLDILEKFYEEEN